MPNFTSPTISSTYLLMESFPLVTLSAIPWEDMLLYRTPRNASCSRLWGLIGVGPGVIVRF